MKKSKLSKLQTILTILLVVAFVCAIALVCDLCIDNISGIANATDNSLPHFTIKTNDGYNWKLLKDNTLLCEQEGVFISTSLNQSDVADILLARIKQELVNDGIVDSDYIASNTSVRDKYTLDIELSPVRNARITGSTNQTYYTNEFDSTIFIGGADYSLDVATSEGIAVSEGLQYLVDGNWVNAETTKVGNSLMFGKGVSVGTYQVRYVVSEKFVFDGVEQVAYHYPPIDELPIECVILSRQITPPSANAVATYGTQAKDIKVTTQEADAYQGKWVLSSNQTDVAFNDVEDVNTHILKAGTYAVLFDFIPYDSNISPVYSVEIITKILPKTIKVYIGDIIALVGEELKDVGEVPYSFDEEQLVDGDTLEDLHLTFYYGTIDTSRAGTYDIYARISNANYILSTGSSTSQFLDQGRYMVYYDKIVVSADIQFEVYISTGFVNISVSVIALDNADADDIGNGWVAVAVYKFVFVDRYHNEIAPPDEYTIVFENVPNGATHFVVVGRQGASKESVDNLSSVTLQNGEDTIAFVKKVTTQSNVNPSSNKNPLELAATVLGIIGGLLMLGSAIIGVNLFFGNMSSHYKNDVYVRESVQKTIDCEDCEQENADNRNENNQPKEAQKKQRHGKKNKQARQEKIKKQQES